MRISDWSSDVCSSDLRQAAQGESTHRGGAHRARGSRPSQDRKNRPVQGAGKHMTPLPIRNSWVLVTGASTGLGRASALHLAALYQAKPLIVGRRLDNLLDLQAEIGARFDVPCEIIGADQREIDGREKIGARGTELQVKEP